MKRSVSQDLLTTSHAIKNPMGLYRRNKIKGGCYFFTVTLCDRQSNVLIENIADLRYAMKTVQPTHPYKTEAIVILPDHIHAIWQLPDDEENYSIRW